MGGWDCGWMLRELRPVAYAFREGPEAKYTRYGFIAQEVERAFPGLVRHRGDRVLVLYQDFVALLTLAAQTQEQRLTNQSNELSQLSEVRSLQEELRAEQAKRVALQAQLSSLERRIAQAEKT